jgi:hypothetical protein
VLVVLAKGTQNLTIDTRSRMSRNNDDNQMNKITATVAYTNGILLAAFF